MRHPWCIPTAFALLGTLPLAAQAASSPEADSSLKDLLELLDTPVVSASNTAEKLSEAPATLIIISRAEIERRGYSELSQILDDLPGMQLSRSFGDYSVKNYWRGFRNYLGDPFLMMVDGLTQNSLYFNATESALRSLPLSNVDHIEVVYGPASAVYGSNAFMGVINVITTKDMPKDGSYQNARLIGGTNELRVLDGSSFFKVGAIRFSATARLEQSLFDTSQAEEYEYTKASYTTDRRRWGGFVDNPNLSGPRSENREKALDLRAFLGTTEMGFTFHNLRSGYGAQYAYDLTQPNAIWSRRELSLHLVQRKAIRDGFHSTTTLRYRESGITPDSTYLDAGPWNAAGVWGAAFSWWQAKNSSWTLLQDFDLRATSRLSFNFGIKYEKKDIQKKYDNPYGIYQTPAEWLANGGNYPYPTPPQDITQAQNRAHPEDRGLYLQGRFRLTPQDILILGGRSDHNSAYGTANTLRMGYVGNHGPWGFKALYGEGFQEPTPRTLFGEFRGAGSDPNLKPEQSKTIEVSAGYTSRLYSGLASFWKVRNSETIAATVGGAKNLGSRDITGIDLHGQFLATVPGLRQFNLWGYFSHLLKSEGSNKPDASGNVILDGLTKDGHIGDLAKDQLRIGATADFNFPFTATLLGRYIGGRDTVATNPVGSVASHVTLDLILMAKDCFGWAKGLNFTFKVANLTDKGYFHPGLSQAGAGSAPGAWGPDGIWLRPGETWSGEKGYYSSLLPQPGRNIQFTVGMNF